IGTMGASGGGGRAMIVATLSPHIRAHLNSMMMTTFKSLLPAHLDAHSWLLYSPGIAAFSDWPLIPLHSVDPAPRSMHVQFAIRDRLFPLEGMQTADAILKRYAKGNITYSSSWHDNSHQMTHKMQLEAA